MGEKSRLCGKRAVFVGREQSLWEESSLDLHRTRQAPGARQGGPPREALLVFRCARQLFGRYKPCCNAIRLCP